MQDGSSQGSVAYAPHAFIMLAVLVVACLMTIFA